MRRICLFLFFLIFLTSFSIALDCQYTEIENYYENEMAFYHNDDFIGYNLDLEKLIKLEKNQLVITIYNDLDYDISLEVSYTVYSKHFGRNDKRIVDIDISARESEIIKDSWQDSYLGDSNVWITDLTYRFKGDDLISNRIESAEKEIISCKICINDTCLNDGDFCNTISGDTMCGSGICNIAGSCGKEKIVDCPEGLKNCNNKFCLEASTKDKGSSYDCKWECISQRGEEGICLISHEQEEFWNRIKLILFSLLILGGLFLIGYFGLWKKTKPVIKRYRKSKQRLEEIEKEISSLENERKMKEEDLILIKKRYKFDLVKQNRKLKEIEKTNEKISKALSKRNKLAEHSRRITKKEILSSLKKYQREYSEKMIKYDKGSGYLIFSSNGEAVHRYRYRAKYGIGHDYRIHHIDRDKLNNEYWNLIPLKKEEHNEINHGKISFKNWKEGIKELRKITGIEKRFNSEIKKKLKRKK